MDETSQQPSICVDIDSLYDGSYNGAYTPSTTAAVGEELSLFVRMDKEICPVLSADSPLGGSSRPLDLQHVDFLGSVDVVKKLFSMPYTDQRPLFAFHRMGNTLLLDCVTGNDKNPYDITFPVDSENTKYQHSSHLDTTSVGWSSPTSSIASTGDKLGSLHFADSSFDSLDHLITSSSIESILGKVTPLYLPAPTKSLRPDFSVGLLTNEESVQNQTDSLRDATNVGRPERRTGTGSLVSSGGNRETADISNPVGGIDVDVDVQSGIESSGLEELKRELSIASGSPFLPPPNYFMPSVPPPAKQVLSWDLHEMRLALSSDVTIYRTEQHPAFTVKTLDTTREFELSTCLDLYLDNVMANVPEFALALHTKGFIRGIKLVRTSDIPFLNPTDVSEVPSQSTSSSVNMRRGRNITSDSNGSDRSNTELSNFTAGQGAPTPSSSFSSSVGDRAGRNGRGRDTWPHCTSSGGEEDGDGDEREQQQPMFDPKVIDMDATTILRFLHSNCRREDGTYILHQSTDGEALHLYDLGLASYAKQKHFKWMLAMLSYRFAIRLGHHIKIATPRCRVQIRQRQMHLFSSTYQLLRDIKEMGGEDHGTIRAAVLEQMADAHLSRVDAFSTQGKKENVQGQTDRMKPDAKVRGKEENVSHTDEEDFDQHVELQEAVELLCRAVECLGALINKEIASMASSTANDGSENETKDREGDSNSLFKSEEDQGGDDVDDDEDGDVDEEGLSGIVETLAVQLAGVLHKLVQASLVMVINCIRTAKIGECMDCLSRLVVPCNLWSQLKFTILSSVLKANEMRAEKDKRDCKGLWGADMTIVQSLPVLWDLTGETCREIAKQTAGVSLEDTDIKQRLDTLVLTWSRLSQSVLNDGASSISQCELSPLNPVATDGLPLSCITRSVSSPTGPGDAMATGQSKRAKARAKAKMRAKENSATSDGQVKELREVLGNSVTTRNWQMLAGSLPTISPDIASERLPNGRIQEDVAVVVDRPDPIRALHDIHSMVAPLVLCDLEHLTCVQQLNICVRSMHLSECSETGRECESIDITLDSLFPHVALTPAVVHAVGAEKGCQDELRVILLMTYCFLSAALLHHLKAIGGIKHHTRNDGGANNSMKKTKSQRAQRAGGAVGPQGLKVSDPSVRLCLRRLGDSCNGISQRLVSFAATTPVESTDASPIDPDSKGTAGSNVASDIDMKKECLALAHRLFSASLVLFESVGDISNAAMVRCNLSSLQRSLATWEMDRFSAMSGSGSVGHGTDAEYSGYYERSLKSLKEAQRHCDLAVVSFDGSDVDFGTGKIHIPKGNIRNAVALETAHNCLNIGVLKKSELFRSHVYGVSSDGKERMEAQAALIAEKEKAVVGALETALELFYELRYDRQAAAAHYQLGSFYSSYWPLCPNRSDGLLEKGLLHYKEAHSYYSKYDVGPTLLLIAIDMCDLYLSIYSATEPFLNTTSAAGSLSDSTSQGSPSPVVGRVLQGIVGDTGGTTKDVAGTSVEDLGNVSDVTVPPGTGSESEVVIALLGGALESLLESRFAFTPAVAERSRHSRQILSLADDVAKRLGSVLVKVLKAHTKGLLLSPNSPEQTLDANLLRQALQVSVKGPDDKAAISTVETSASGTAAASSMSMTGKGMVLEVRAVCSELLRWTVSMTPTPSSPTLSPPPISASNGTSTQPAGGGGGQGPGSIPVNRLYELIDTLNQNNWLRRHVIGNKKYT